MPEIVTVKKLDAQLAEAEQDQLIRLLDLIDERSANREFLLAEETPDGRRLHAKWQHSFALYLGEEAVGIALIYERAADSDPLYQQSELHIGSLAVAEHLQGEMLGRRMLRLAIDNALGTDFKDIGGPVEHIGLTVAYANMSARRIYHWFGFSVVGTYNQDGEEMCVMRADIDTVNLADGYQRTTPLQGIHDRLDPNE